MIQSTVTFRLLAVSVVACLALSCQAPADARKPTSRGSDLLYIWAGDADEQEADFLAVVDARPGSTRCSVIKGAPQPA